MGFLTDGKLREQLILNWIKERDFKAIRAFQESPEAAAQELLKRGFHKEDSFKQEIAAGLQGMISKKVGICCFSELENNTLMFSHYADSHMGCCIGFNKSGDILEPARPVKYSDRIPTVSAFALDSNEFVDVILFTKSTRWEYEREWHMVYRPGLVQLKARTITSVTFGTRSTAESINRIRRIVTEVRAPMEFRQARQVTGSYDLEITTMTV
jgi:hypothetical protein